MKFNMTKKTKKCGHQWFQVNKVDKILKVIWYEIEPKPHYFGNGIDTKDYIYSKVQNGFVVVCANCGETKEIYGKIKTQDLAEKFKDKIISIDQKEFKVYSNLN